MYITYSVQLRSVSATRPGPLMARASRTFLMRTWMVLVLHYLIKSYQEVSISTMVCIHMNLPVFICSFVCDFFFFIFLPVSDMFVFSPVTASSLFSFYGM